MATLAFGPIVSTPMAIRATGNSAAGLARRWVTERDTGRRLGHPAAVGALTAVVAVAYCGFALAQYSRGSRSGRPSTQASTSGMRR